MTPRAYGGHASPHFRSVATSPGGTLISFSFRRQPTSCPSSHNDTDDDKVTTADYTDDADFDNTTADYTYNADADNPTAFYTNDADVDNTTANNTYNTNADNYNFYNE